MVPVISPETIPVVAPMPATPGVPLIQLLVLLLEPVPVSTMVAPAHRADGPLITGRALTVTVVVI